jgi:hypothetical protein
MTRDARNDNGGVIFEITPPLFVPPIVSRAQLPAQFPSVIRLPSRYLFAASNSDLSFAINSPRLSYSRFNFRGFFLPSE